MRSWSKYPETIKELTLCGMPRQYPIPGENTDRRCTEEASEVSCPYCLELMRSSEIRKRATCAYA